MHWPLAFVFAPASSQVLAAGVSARRRRSSSVSVKSTCSPAAGDEAAVPVSFSSVTVKVCGWPISFVAFGVIEILRVDPRLDRAGPEFAPVPFVCRGQRDAADRDRRRAR